MPVMTRKATARDLEEKLRVTLVELKKYKDLSDKLLQEREDSEIEVNNIVQKNSDLKCELADLHTKLSDSIHVNEQLKDIVVSFKQCSDTYEQALSRITELEFDLNKAHQEILVLKSSKFNERTADTVSLYNELIGSGIESSGPQPMVTIDLTSDHSLCSNSNFKSHKKIKIYLKVKKIIRKCQKTLKKRNYFLKNVDLIKEKLLLEEKLQSCTDELEITKRLYDDDILKLRSDLLEKEKILQDIFSGYILAQNHLSEHYKQAIGLMDLVTSNVESVRDIERNSPSSHSQSLSRAGSDSIEASNDKIILSTDQGEVENVISRNHIKRVLVFSDAIGRNFGSLLGNLQHCSVINHCMPGASYVEIEKKIMASEIDNTTIVVVYLGQSLGIDRKDIITRTTSLLKLNAFKIMLISFPYSNVLTKRQNEHIHSLNTLMYNMTCRHSDKFLFFDCNNFITNFKLTRDRMYLPKRYRNLIATLVAYNINAVIGNITKCSNDITVLSTSTNNINCLNF